MTATAPHYELFDHTADMGIRVRAPTLAGLIAPATEGLYAVIGRVVAVDVRDASGECAASGKRAAAEGAARAGPAMRTFELHGDDPALLLRDYLGEVLHIFDVEHRRLIDVQVAEFTPQRLVVTAEARPIDEGRSALEREVKAVTYHELAIRPVAGGYEATYIVDI
jgi:SHS2 domain-containing protein